jgi:hypothetical protein
MLRAPRASRHFGSISSSWRSRLMSCTHRWSGSRVGLLALLEVLITDSKFAAFALVPAGIVDHEDRANPIQPHRSPLPIQGQGLHDSQGANGSLLAASMSYSRSFGDRRR